MSVLITSPNLNDTLFVNSSLAVNDVVNTIAWTDDGAASPYTLSYSTDSGSSWTTIASGITSLTYDWILNETEITDILDGANLVSGIQIQVTDSAGSPTSDTQTAIVADNPIGSIRPNSDNAAIQIGNPVNIRWSNAYDASVSNVAIAFSNNAGSTWTVLTTSTPNDGSYAWIPSGINSTNCQIKITVADPDKSAAEMTSTGVFAINTDTQIAGTGNDGTFAPGRTEFPFRVAAEKAIEADEAITLSQLEPSELIEIYQRNHSGLTTLEESGGDLYKAYNLVFKANPNRLVRSPRALEGVIELTTAAGSQRTGYSSGILYGEVLANTLSHNWALGNTGDDLYVTGQTKWSFDIDFVEVQSGALLTPTGWQFQPFFEATNENTITVYAVNKTSTQSTTPALLKDRVYESDAIQHTYKFRYRLTELIPFTAGV